jgi:hypothetical protein
MCDVLAHSWYLYKCDRCTYVPPVPTSRPNNIIYYTVYHTTYSTTRYHDICDVLIDKKHKRWKLYTIGSADTYPTILGNTGKIESFLPPTLCWQLPQLLPTTCSSLVWESRRRRIFNPFRREIIVLATKHRLLLHVTEEIGHLLHQLC